MKFDFLILFIFGFLGFIISFNDIIMLKRKKWKKILTCVAYIDIVIGCFLSYYVFQSYGQDFLMLGVTVFCTALLSTLIYKVAILKKNPELHDCCVSLDKLNKNYIFFIFIIIFFVFSTIILTYDYFFSSNI
jgi:hypothetical protein